MKISLIISTMLIAQVSASFFDAFQGAMLSVQNGFGKLFTDVVTDVKDTVDCTILAVEHVLSLSADASARYYEKCGNKNTTVQPQPKEGSPTVEISILNNEENLRKEIPAEIDARINATLTKYLNGYNPHERLEDVERGLTKETQRLADISERVKQELDKLSNEIHFDFRSLEHNTSKPSVDSILEQLKLLEAIEKSLKNGAEANEVHQIIDNVLHKLNSIESSEAAESVKVEKLLKDLENNSNSTYKVIRQQLHDLKDDEDKHLDLIKNKIEEHEKSPQHVDFVQSGSVNNTDGIRPDFSSNYSSTTEQNKSLLSTKLPESKANVTTNVTVDITPINLTSNNISSTIAMPVSTTQHSINIKLSNNIITNNSLALLTTREPQKTDDITSLKKTEKSVEPLTKDLDMHNNLTSTAVNKTKEIIPTAEKPSTLKAEQSTTTPSQIAFSSTSSSPIDTQNTLSTTSTEYIILTPTISENKTLPVNHLLSMLQTSATSHTTTIPVPTITRSSNQEMTSPVNTSSTGSSTTPSSIASLPFAHETDQRILSNQILNVTVKSTDASTPTISSKSIVHNTKANFTTTANLPLVTKLLTKAPTTHEVVSDHDKNSVKTSATPVTTDSTRANVHGDRFSKVTTAFVSDKTIDGVHSSTTVTQKTTPKLLTDSPSTEHFNSNTTTPLVIHGSTLNYEKYSANYTTTNKPTSTPILSHTITTPSLHAFLNYIDRLMATSTQPPIMRSIETTETEEDRLSSTIIPHRELNTIVSPDAATISIKTDLHVPNIPTVLNDHPTFGRSLDILSTQLHKENLPQTYNNILGMPRARGLPPPTKYLPSPQPYPLVPLNRPAPPKPLPPPAYNQPPPYGRSVPIAPLNRALPPPPREYNQNPPIQPYNNAIRPPDFNQPSINMNVRSMVFTTPRPFATPKTNNFDDLDYNSFFHIPSKDTESHDRALREARELIADSQRQRRIIDSILNRNKGRSLFGMPKSLNTAK